MVHNIYIDALEYTGYDVSKQIKNKTIFVKYGSATPKRILSNIGYGWSSTEDGMSTEEFGKSFKPDIEAFEKSDICCASYVAYVVFNYLPNIARVDTSKYTQPESKINVSSWLVALEEWIENKLANRVEPDDEDFEWDSIPIGSVLIFGNGEHIALYAGEYNELHFVTHVGNERGPEIHTVEELSVSECGELSEIYVPKYATSKSKIRIISKNESSEFVKNGLFCFYSIMNSKTEIIEYVSTKDDVIEIELPIGEYCVSFVSTKKDFQIVGAKNPVIERLKSKPVTSYNVKITKTYNEVVSVTFYYDKISEKTKTDIIEEIKEQQNRNPVNFLFGFENILPPK